MDIAQNEVLNLNRGPSLVHAMAFGLRVFTYYVLLATLLFTMCAPLYLAYQSGGFSLHTWRSAWELFANNFLFFAFIFEGLIVLAVYKDPRRISFLRLFAYNPTRETDLYFWMYFTAVYFFLPMKIGQSAHLQTIFPIFDIGAWGGELVAFFFLSFTAFFIHWLSHRIPFLWELHKIHHSAKELTCITGPREHLLYEMIHIGIFVLFFNSQNTLVSFAFASRAFLNVIQHSQLNLKFGWLGKFVISPHTHRIHHLRNPAYFNSNFGSDITLWDRLFGTFRYEVPLSTEEMESDFGISETPSDRFVLLELYQTTLSSVRMFWRQTLR